MLEVRQVYWEAAGQEWSFATVRPHIWRAIFEELTRLAIKEYWAEFMHAKSQQVEVGSVCLVVLVHCKLAVTVLMIAGSGHADASKRWSQVDR